MADRDYNTSENRYNSYGRKPYYETAEDYNKAHKSAANSSTNSGTGDYRQSQQYTNVGGVRRDSQGKPMRNHFVTQMVFAIIEMVLCCFNPIIAILAFVALIFALRGNAYYKSGNEIDFKISSKVSSIILAVTGGVMTLNLVLILVLALAFVNSADAIMYEIQDQFENEFGDWKDYLDPVPEAARPGSQGNYESSGEYQGQLSDGSTPLPVGFEEFVLNGTSYFLPMTYQEFQSMGYKLEAGAEEILMEPRTEHSVSFIDENDYMVGVLRFENTSSVVKSLEDCAITSVYLSNQGAYGLGDELDLRFLDDFTVNTSFEELEAYLGAPCYTYYNKINGEVYEDYSWNYYGGNEYHAVYVSYIDGTISSIEITREIY